MTTLPGGIFPPVVTPFKKELFDRQSFVFNLERWNDTELAGYVVLGSNGEGVYLAEDEAISVIEAGAQAKGEDKFLIVGTGRESTRNTVEFTRQAAKAGAQAALVTPPSYYQRAMSDSALEFHYRSVADAAEIPIILYHVPKFSPVVFSPRLVTSLASHPNILGIKESAGNMVLLQAVVRESPDRFRAYVGTGSILLAGLVAGASGGIVALANIAAQACIALLAAVERGDLETARRLQARLLPVNEAVTTEYGVAGLKLALDLLGYRGGEPRRPLEPLSRKQQEELTRILEKGGILAPKDGKGA